MTYCSIDDIKQRMLIESNDTQYDDALNNAANEASELVDIFLKPYEATLPLESPDNQIVAITADFGASIFKRRMLPEEVGIRGPSIIAGGGTDTLTQMDATGWFALALKKMEQYIRNTYVLVRNQITSIHNPEIYADLYRRGLITGQECRDFLNNAVAVYSKRIDDITKTIATNETIVIDKNETVSTYETKRQKSIAFISGGEVITGENNANGYQKDSETNGSA